MVGESDTTATSGGSGSPAGSGQAPTGQEPPTGGNSGNPAGSTASGIDRSKLNPLLQNLDETQLNEVFDTLFTAARNQQGVPEHARQPEPQAPAPQVLDREAIREMFDPTSDKFDPMAVIERHVQQNYGPLLGDINRRALSGVEVALRQQFSDFDKYKSDIDLILKDKPPTAITQQDLLGAYYMAKGARTTEAEIRERQKPPVTQTPSPQAPEPDAGAALTPSEIDVAKIMFRGEGDPVAAFREAKKRAEGGVMKVPGDKK